MEHISFLLQKTRLRGSEYNKPRQALHWSAALALKTAAVGLLTLKQLGKMSKSKKWIRTFEVQTIDDTDGKKVSYQVFSTLYPDGMPEACTKLVTKKSFTDFK